VRAVFDANVAVSALLERNESAVEWLRRLLRRELDVSVPDLLYVEVVQALTRHVRAGDLTRQRAAVRLDFLQAVPFRVCSLRMLAAPALGVALERDLTAYDACYAVLAEAEDAVLVTGDVQLAAASRRAELVQ
jgi:predicted nucleic acid-binding protein